MPFTKLCDGPGEGTGAEYNYLATSKAALNLFGRKGVDLPKHSWYHRTTLHGGMAFEYDLASKSSKLTKFPQVDLDEDCEDHIFSLDGKAYMMTYCHMGSVRFRELFFWCTKSGAWKSVGKLTADEGCEEDGGQNHHVMFYTDKPNRRLIIGYTTGGIRNGIKILAMSLDGLKVSLLTSADMTGLPPMGCEVTHLALLNDSVAVVITGCQMCGFHWQPDKPIIIDLEEKKALVTEASGESLFSFSGAKYAFMTPGGNWVHLMGSVASGMCDSKSLVDVAVFNAATKSWKKSNITIPADLNLEEAYAGRSAATDGAKLYVGDRKVVYEIDVAEFDS